MAFELDGISAGYGEGPVLDRITLRFEPRSVTVVLGPSGCGKTTLLNVIAGLKRPSSGERRGFEGTSFSYAFQDPRLLPWESARENIAFALSGALGRPEALARADRFLAAAGLAERAGSVPARLSGGMRQRLSLARAFAFPSELLLLDEAFKAVDLKTKLELMDAFLGLQAEERRTVVAVTHDVEEAAYLADRAVVLSSRPARVIADFPIEVPRGERSLGSAATMEAEARLYRLALG
ncbi:MAG TPA: ABC transporter ATP-binding protein [Spirochaetales bacterium]|nr:ABC transporter ATP-binding protein [Spirochaetales bacterium]HRY55481.1 ABC transporter ATP-binding protein [Spirochaetia bacterium]HRZ65492.1 ABC transporter ATP-binding protein [Spirochaetia bacterium]